MAYHTLISRPAHGTANTAWGIQFGDHDRQCVAAELADMKRTDRANGEKNEYRIIRTATAHQVRILAAIAAL